MGIIKKGKYSKKEKCNHQKKLEEKRKELEEKKEMNNIIASFNKSRVELLKKYVIRMPKKVWAIGYNTNGKIVVYTESTKPGTYCLFETDYRDNDSEVLYALSSIYPFVKIDTESERQLGKQNIGLLCWNLLLGEWKNPRSGFSEFFYDDFFTPERKAVLKYGKIELLESVISKYNSDIFDAIYQLDKIWNTSIPHEFNFGRKVIFDRDSVDSKIQQLVKLIDKEKVKRTEQEKKKQELFEQERQQDIEKKIKCAGDKGEDNVSYALRYLDGYTVLDRNGNAGKPIKLLNSDYIGEEQEIDHIAIGNIGIIHIETKAYSGKIIIDESGNWSREKDGDYIGIENPLQQVRRHEKVIKSIVGDIPVYSFICIARENAIIQGINYSKIPIVKTDMLVERIEELEENNKFISDEDIKKSYELICNHLI